MKWIWSNEIINTLLIRTDHVQTDDTMYQMRLYLVYSITKFNLKGTNVASPIRHSRYRTISSLKDYVKKYLVLHLIFGETLALTQKLLCIG